MSGQAGASVRTATLTNAGRLMAIRWIARHPDQNGRTVPEALALIARLADEALEREPLP